MRGVTDIVERIGQVDALAERNSHRVDTVILVFPIAVVLPRRGDLLGREFRFARFSRAVTAVKDTAAEELRFRGDACLLQGGCGDKKESCSRFEVEDHGCRLFSFFRFAIL